MTTKIKRSQIKTFLNTGSIASPTWSLLGDGITSAVVNMNPKTAQETYIHEDSGTISVEGYAPTMAVEATCKAGDPAFEWLDDLRKSRGVLSEAETEVVNAWLYEGHIASVYPAEKCPVSIQTDSFGGEGGSAAKLNFTINYIGDPIKSAYDTLNAKFLPLPIDAGLTSLALTSGTLVLDPPFNKNWYLYFTQTDDVSNVITAVAEKVGSSISITVNGESISNGGTATWDEGENIVIVQVTNGAEVVKYYVKVLYEPSE